MADQTPAAQSKQPTIPYTSWKSVLNVADRFRETGLPPRIDRSVLGGSEGQKTQIIATLRFFGWAKENGDVTDSFSRFVNASDKDRKALMKELLAKYYPKATELAAVNATTRQLEESFSGITGDTLRKAVAFYLGAAKYADHPVSKHFKVPSFVARSNGPRRQPAAMRSADEEEESPPPPPIADAKARYLDMLLEKAKASDTLDTGLLDRIEKLLGYPTDESTSA
jgi:hypothetical protein